MCRLQTARGETASVVSQPTKGSAKVAHIIGRIAMMGKAAGSRPFIHCGNVEPFDTRLPRDLGLYRIEHFNAKAPPPSFVFSMRGRDLLAAVIRTVSGHRYIAQTISASRLFGQDHASKQSDGAFSRFNMKRWRSNAGVQPSRQLSQSGFLRLRQPRE